MEWTARPVGMGAKPNGVHEMMRTLPLVFMMAMGVAAQLRAQDDPEYRMEIGAGVGVAGYLGDFNGSLVKNLQPCATALGRYVIDPYMALKLNVACGKMKGSSANAGTYYPDFANAPYAFANTLYEMCLTYEYNFWPYGTGRDYRGAKRITPFVFAGIGATYVAQAGKSEMAMNVPLGLGVKYKVARRLNVGVEWGVHFAQTDRIDGVKDPYHVVSGGLFKNTDCYHALTITVSYSFMPKCTTCNKE